MKIKCDFNLYRRKKLINSFIKYAIEFFVYINLEDSVVEHCRNNFKHC